MEDIEKGMQKALEWARISREKWRLLYINSTEAKDAGNADLAVRQIARFDRIIESYKALIAEPGRYKSN